MSNWLNKINIVFSKIDKTPITDEDIDYIYDHLDRDCLVTQNPFQKHEAIMHQEDITWSSWRKDLQDFCSNTEGFSVYAHVYDEYGNQDIFSQKSSGQSLRR